MPLTISIQKRFEKFKLNASFEAGDSVTGLLGASGCGKSMTLKCIAGIETPDAGRIVLNARVLFDAAAGVNLTPQQRRVGYLFQHYALFPNMTALQNITAGVRAGSAKARRAKAEELIETFYLTDQAQKYPRQLSGGQQQRVALARILAGTPEVLLLDEPFSALDSYLKWQVELELMELLADFPGPVLFVTHNRDEVYRMCREVCVLNHGRSESMRPVEELFETPGTYAACLLSGCKNVSRAQALPDGRVEALDWGLTLTPAHPPAAGLTHLGVRSHTFRLSGDGPNCFSCPVIRVIEDVFTTVVLLQTPAPGERGRLRVELPKERWHPSDIPPVLQLTVEPQDLLLLYG